jgi:anti-sigma28 factor (negative regulator of flagellin synthesis)
MISKTGLSGVLQQAYQKVGVANEAAGDNNIKKSANNADEKLTKVESLKQAIQNGEYKINIEATAAKVTDSLL